MTPDKIKTFPLTTTQSFLDRIGEAATTSKHDYILEAIAEKLEKDGV